MMNNFILNAFNVYRAKSVHVKTKGELISVIVAVIIYFVLNFILQSVCKNMTQKKINTISVIVAAAVGIVLIIVIE